MKDKELMLKGELYNPFSSLLTQQRERCKELCHKYNNLNPFDKQRDILIRQILGKTGHTLLIEPLFYCDYGYNIGVGENFYSNHNLVILDCAKVTFGDNVLIGPNCSFYSAEHPLDVKTRNSGLEYAKAINVASNVWIGGSVSVLGGVSIGQGAVIGAGSVVVKDIPENCLAVGNPCRVIRELKN